jgi:hypothetical protein
MRVRRLHKLAALVALALVACSADALLLGAPCPCIDGYVCCAATQTCAAASQGCAEPLSITRVDPSSGPSEGGTELRILGTGFDADVEVALGGAVCRDVVRDSSAEVRCTVPAGPAEGGAVDVRVRTGQSEAVLPSAFRYLSPWLRDVTSDDLRAAPSGRGAALVDLDLDGRLELVLAHDDAAFVPPTVLTFEDEGWRASALDSPAVPGHVGVSAVDVIGDARPELVFAGGPARSAVGALTFEGAGWRAVDVDPLGPRGFDLAVPVDLDDDGTVELVGCMRNDEFPGEGRFVVLGGSQGRLQREEAAPDPPLGAQCDAVAVGDFDADGDPDVAACGSFFGLWENRGGQLFDVTVASGLERWSTCAAVSWVDFDADGDLDLAYTRDGTQGDEPSGIGLLRNVGSGAFEAVSALDLDPPATDCRVPDDAPWSGASLRYGGRTMAWTDVDHDGDLDVFVPLPSFRCGMGPVLLLNRHGQGQAGFSLVRLDVSGHLLGATAIALADFDEDGDQDVVVHAEPPSAPRALRSEVVDAALSERRWLRVRPREGERPAWGATVRVFAGEQPAQIRTLGPDGHLGMSEPVAHFGLGAYAGPVRVVVDFGPATRRELEVEADVTRVTVDACREGPCE